MRPCIFYLFLNEQPEKDRGRGRCVCAGGGGGGGAGEMGGGGEEQRIKRVFVFLNGQDPRGVFGTHNYVIVKPVAWCEHL